MSKIDQTFKDICGEILSLGIEYENKNRGVKRLQIPSCNFYHDFKDGFPALSLKQLFFKSVVTELLWFLNGDNDIKYLRDNSCSIWDDDAFNYFVKNNPGLKISKEEFKNIGAGSVGRNYSVQWRSFNSEVDQIKDLIKGMEKDIFSSRLIVTAWNPSDLDKTALPACHNFFQVIGDLDEEGNACFWLLFNMRSWDFFLGSAFNIASYALLAKILEKVTGIKSRGIICNAACVHFYDNQYEAAREILTRDDFKHSNAEVRLPDVPFEAGSTAFEKFEQFLAAVKPGDFKLENYTFDPAIKVDMLAPISI